MKSRSQTLLLASNLPFALFAFGCSSNAAAPATPPPDGGRLVLPDASHRDTATSEPDGATASITIDPFSAVTGSSAEHEPFLAVTPGGRIGVSFLAATNTGSTYYTVGYRISNDAGETWGPATLFPVPTGDNIQANASVAAGDDGTLYMSWAAEGKTVSGVRSAEQVYVAVSPPGTTTFGTPVVVSDPTFAVSVYDQPRVMVTHAGVLNVGYLAASPDGLTSWIVNARSTDGGKTWARAFAAGPGSSGSGRNEARFCRPPGTGRIFMFYQDTDVATYSGDIAAALLSSDDDGATWSSPIAVTSSSDELILDDSANQGCITSGTDLWLYYGLSDEANLGQSGDTSTVEPTMNRIRLAHSSDNGMTIDIRSDVMDTRAGIRAMYPVLAWEGEKTLDLAYYSGNFDLDPNAELRRSRSTDGMTFAPSAFVASPLTLETSREVPQWVGDYCGAGFYDGTLFLVNTDNSTATPHVAFHRMPAPLPAGAGEPDASVSPDASYDAGFGVACYIDTKFTPVTWAPPSAFGQSACTAAQTSSYLSCLTTTGNCTAFRSDTTNAGCVACLETEESASAHGPVVVQAASGQIAIAELNYGGCQAHFDGHGAAGSCGNQANNSTDCVNFECGSCSDFDDPSEGGPTYNCYYTAIESGVCTAFRETTDCAYEVDDGGTAAPCTNPEVFIPLWCGGGGGDAGGDGG